MRSFVPGNPFGGRVLGLEVGEFGEEGVVGGPVGFGAEELGDDDDCCDV